MTDRDDRFDTHAWLRACELADLQATSLRLVLALHRTMDRSGWTPSRSYEELSERTGLALRSLKRHAADLSSSGLLRQVRGEGFAAIVPNPALTVPNPAPTVRAELGTASAEPGTKIVPNPALAVPNPALPNSAEPGTEIVPNPALPPCTPLIGTPPFSPPVPVGARTRMYTREEGQETDDPGPPPPPPPPPAPSSPPTPAPAPPSPAALTFRAIVELLDRHCPWWGRPGATPPPAAAEAIAEVVRRAPEREWDLERIEAVIEEIAALGEDRVQWPAAVLRSRLLLQQPDPPSLPPMRRQPLATPVAGKPAYVIQDGDFGVDPATGRAAQWSAAESRWIDNEELCRARGLEITESHQRAIDRLTGRRGAR